MDFLEMTPTEFLGPLNAWEAKHAPKKLYLAGDPLFFKAAARVSIIGSRKASVKGIGQATKVARMLANKGIIVVSGLAEGIDTAAHKAAIDAGGRTVAVLGTPLDKFYPPKNRGLQERIMQEHLVISQFPKGQATQRMNFPLRNRTMALISNATIIVEAGETSGSLHQGWEAIRLGRPLYIMKSVAENPGLDWPGKMMQYGAEVLSELAFESFLEVLPDMTETQELMLA